MNVQQFIPADIPSLMHEEYLNNYNVITKNTGRLFLFAGDQKIEHLHKDFYGPNIDTLASNPEQLFLIASKSRIGAFATQLGLIARYGHKYPDINYIIKLNSKTDIISLEHKDPISTQLWCVDDVLKFKAESKLPIRGIGYTVYLGSEHENIMLAQAAQAIYSAHQNGLITILWMYPRGKYVLNELDAKLIAGAAGVANCLGSDFAKIIPPLTSNSHSSADLLKIATQAAGNTKLICSGGKSILPEEFLRELYKQIHIGGTCGSATGRNIYQKSTEQAIAFTQAISSLVYDNADIDTALKLLKI